MLHVLVAAGCLTLLAAPATAIAGSRPPVASPSPGVFGIGPSSARAVDGRPYYYYLAQPGSSFSDHVAVVNVGTAPITLSIYATDAGNSADGSFAFPAAATRPVDVGTWVHIAMPGGGTTITLRGRSKTYLPVTVTVPAKATPGDHAGAIIASLQGEVKNSQGQLVHLDQRVATRMFLRVSGPLHPMLAIEHLAVSYTGGANPVARGDVTVTYVVRNTGNVRLGGSQTVEVSGSFGSVRADDVAQVPLLLPGGSAQQSVTVHGVVPQMWMTGTVTVWALGLSGDVDPAAGPWTATAHFWAVPWSLLALILLLVLGTLVYERIRRRRRPARGAESPPAAAPVRTKSEAREGVPS